MNTDESIEPEPFYGLKAGVIYFRKVKGKDTWVGCDSQHKSYIGRFPNQKIPMHEVFNLDNPDDNPLMQECPADEIRYFHFPANSMSWIEKAITKYYNEESKPFRKTNKLLAHEFWRGQMHGSGDALRGKDPGKRIGARVEHDGTKRGAPVHARHMRSKCFGIPRDPRPSYQDNTSNRPSSPSSRTRPNGGISFPLQPHMQEKNIALFLPYLHWEASGLQAKMTQVIHEELGHKGGKRKLDNAAKKIEITEEPRVYHIALMIVDQCSRVFFDRAKPLDERPAVMDLFAAAIGHVTEETSVAYDSLWRQLSLRPGSMHSDIMSNYFYPTLQLSSVLFKEAQDIAEELKIMKNIYTEQLKVVKDFKKHLEYPLGKIPRRGEAATFIRILQELAGNQAVLANGDVFSDDEEDRAQANSWEGTLIEAEGTLELIESRQAEIQDLEDSALHSCQQLQVLLSLVQQQISLVEAGAALQRADETAKQGRAIMAFTIVTIFFLPLGFFATFFGMNNEDINEAHWMTLKEQISYMLAPGAEEAP
ncbi:hypothetical protein SLS62_010140 [Diatrype stigma]|uniref:Uncharacterized protein n=1 Tax=Diatrype stigma TaxID=117547 RepID=A0AAN9UAM9_9PEZI